MKEPPENVQSPQFVKMSRATAISLGLMRGRMHRGAVNRCVNLLLHYPEGCSANCAYCGLAKRRPGTYLEKSFIHVEWPVYSMDAVSDSIRNAPAYVKRTCISMITNGKCLSDTLCLADRLSRETTLPLSVLVSPTLLDTQYLADIKAAGVDKIGVALDLANPQLFDLYRGSGVSGPHRWDRYWEILSGGIEIFGPFDVGAHLMVGMGETEKEMVSLMEKLSQMGIVNHLFSFFAEKGSIMADRPQPPWPGYLRVQLARYLIEGGLGRFDTMVFDTRGRIIDFGLARCKLSEVIDSGIPFMTAGCLGPDGKVACNRPFGNCLPDVKQWNYPYRPNEEELTLIRRSILSTD
jgi:biotin synthase